MENFKEFRDGRENMKNLVGGSGFDIYLVSDRGIINDIDYSGLIMFNDKSLAGKKTKVDEEDTYEDDHFVYSLDGADMRVTEKATKEYITIKNFNFHSVADNVVCRRGEVA